MHDRHSGWLFRRVLTLVTILGLIAGTAMTPPVIGDASAHGGFGTTPEPVPGTDDDPGVTGSRDAGGSSTTEDDVLRVTQSQDAEVLAVGEWRHYTLTVVNKTDERIENYVLIDHVNLGNVTGVVDYKVTCLEGTCPDWASADPKVKAKHVVRDAYFIAGPNAYQRYGNRFGMDANASFTVELALKLKLEDCLPGGRIDVSNAVRWENIGPGASPTQLSDNILTGSITGEACPETTLEVTAAQAHDSVTAGEEQTYTLTIANTGDSQIGDDDRGLWMSWNLSTVNNDEIDADWTIACGPNTTAPCPITDAGTRQTRSKSGVAFVYDTGYVLPANKTLEFVVTATMKKSECATGGAQADIPIKVALELRKPKGVVIANAYDEPILEGNLTPGDCESTSLTIESSQATDTLDQGTPQTRTYRIANTGNSDISGLSLVYPLTTKKPLYTSRDSATTLTTSWACGAESTIDCPDWVAAAGSTIDSEQIPERYDLLGDDGKAVNLPAGKELVLELTLTLAIADEKDSAKGDALAVMRGVLIADSPKDIHVEGDSSSDPLVTTLTANGPASEPPADSSTTPPTTTPPTSTPPTTEPETTPPTTEPETTPPTTEPETTPPTTEPETTPPTTEPTSTPPTTEPTPTPPAGNRLWGMSRSAIAVLGLAAMMVLPVLFGTSTLGNMPHLAHFDWVARTVREVLAKR